ncbi:hypothetical protein ACFOGJ_05010 [Marinibaculum pumilum]|uniref:Uncharacterized protein n=1 Tax=Marinibaculum pumilum TaxID=1766165 RepID=A0ABV7KW33_9PROT
MLERRSFYFSNLVVSSAFIAAVAHNSIVDSLDTKIFATNLGNKFGAEIEISVKKTPSEPLIPQRLPVFSPLHDNFGSVKPSKISHLYERLGALGITNTVTDEVHFAYHRLSFGEDSHYPGDNETGAFTEPEGPRRS